MSTIAKEFTQIKTGNFAATNSRTASLSLSQRYNRFIDGLTFSHFAVMSMAILIGSCWGSIVAMFVFMAGLPTWVFGIGLFSCMANLVACISQAPTKWVVNMFSLSVVVNVILLAVALASL